MKKVLFLSNRGLLPIEDGHTRRSFNLLKGLAKEFDVTFLSLQERASEISDDSMRQMEALCSEVEFIRCPPKQPSFGMMWRLVRSLFSKDPYSLWRHYSSAFEKRVAERVARGGYNIVHCDNLPICNSVQSLDANFVSLTDHDISYIKTKRMASTTKNLPLKIFLSLESLKLKALESRIFDSVDLGIVVSENDRNHLQSLSPKARFAVVENGVDTALFRPSEVKPEKDKLVWLGGFNHAPNKEGMLFFLDKVYPAIKRKRPTVQLDVIGGGVDSTLQRYADKDTSIQFLGFVDDPLATIHNAEVFVAPMLSGGGTKLKVLEAMAAGKAIVTTSVGSEGLDVTSGCEMLVADSPEIFASHVIDALGDENLRGTLEKKAVEFVQDRYSFDAISKKLCGIYHRV